MANLDLNALRKDLDVTYGDWTITYGEAEAPKEVKFHHVLTATPDERIDFWNTMGQLGRFATGQLSEQDKAEFGSSEPYVILTEKIKGAMRSLAVKKTEFDKFAKACGKEFILWDGIIGSYIEHFNLLPGEQKPSQNS